VFLHSFGRIPLLQSISPLLLGGLHVYKAYPLFSWLDSSSTKYIPSWLDSWHEIPFWMDSRLGRWFLCKQSSLSFHSRVHSPSLLQGYELL
jgi:hypothetical protein